ncbi:MAG: AmmeMemoRadiSam system radical SAM enzyme [Planctomycetes bacterium RBG_13_62_9]|nr:MAG: AmmeMemoRadiSam system radical SAM enzyme [Planctomycetes bacterium RBG_13_62_9]
MASVQCELCPKGCIIGPGQSGQCRVRVNVDGVLRTVVYGYPCTINIDPMEKKPLFHFLPGTPVLSLATVGCNLHCKNCQNWEISQANPEDSQAVACPPAKVVALTKQYNCASIAYTYTEPIVYYEYTCDTARLARQAGIRNALVTAGYVNEPPWRELLQYVDAARVDLKSMSDAFYRDVCSATLKPVQNALVVAKSMGVHVEVVNLVIPTLNDKPEQIRELVQWVRVNLGAETPLHFSGFTPMYRMQHLPPTSPGSLESARNIALAEGLKHVYIGNRRSEKGQNTYCPGCNALLIERVGYTIVQNRMAAGRCPDCGREIYGVWK